MTRLPLVSSSQKEVRCENVNKYRCTNIKFSKYVFIENIFLNNTKKKLKKPTNDKSGIRMTRRM
jgi:hypothetical protein